MGTPHCSACTLSRRFFCVPYTRVRICACGFAVRFTILAQRLTHTNPYKCLPMFSHICNLHSCLRFCFIQWWLWCGLAIVHSHHCHLSGLLTFGHVHWKSPCWHGAIASCVRSNGLDLFDFMVLELHERWTCSEFSLISVGDMRFTSRKADYTTDAQQFSAFPRLPHAAARGFSWVNGWTTWVTRSSWAASRTAASTTATSEQANVGRVGWRSGWTFTIYHLFDNGIE